MPIVYNPETHGWYCKEPTEAERKALIEIAVDYITDGLGAEVANNILAAHFGPALADIEPDQMGQA